MGTGWLSCVLMDKNRGQDRPVVPRGGLSGPVLATGSVCSGSFLENLQASLLELPPQQMALSGSSRHLSLLVPSFPHEVFLVESVGFTTTYVLSHLLPPPRRSSCSSRLCPPSPSDLSLLSPDRRVVHTVTTAVARATLPQV